MFKLRSACFFPDTDDISELERKSSKRWSKRKFRRKSDSRKNSEIITPSDEMLNIHREVSYIELIRENNQSLGIIFSGGVDQASSVTIQEISPDSIAAKSEALQVGDVIRGINGIKTNHLTHAEVADILLNAGPVVSLQLEFNSTQEPTCGFEKSKVTSLTFPREKSDYGFSIEGPEAAPVSDEYEIRISHVHTGSSPFQLGLLKPGDKLLSINGVSLKGASLREALSFMAQGGELVSFDVEYPVAVHDNLKSAKGPFTLELLRAPGSSLGLSLVGSPIPGGPTVISSIRAGSIADRSGALNVGDQIISINGQNIQGSSVLDSSKLLQQPTLRVSLELLPELSPFPRNPYLLNDFSAARIINCDSISHLNAPADLALRSVSAMSSRSVISSQRLPTRQESLIVQLFPTLDGYGISIGTLNESGSGPVIIANVDFSSPAYICGVLMEGDRILTVNDRPVHSAVQCQQLLQDSLVQNRVLDLLVEVDVNEAVTPSSGTFSIKLMRSGLSSLGITLNGPGQGERGAIWMANIKKGGVAYRSGSLQIGDVLVAINGQSLSNCTLNDAVQLLQNPEDVVTLKVTKETQLLGPKLSDFNSITYTVELPKDKGDLGISLRGTSSSGSSVIISHLMEGGVASRTEAIHVGDEILSINGISLKDKSLQECARMLEEAEIVVALQIRKPDPNFRDSVIGQQTNPEWHAQCSLASPLQYLADQPNHLINPPSQPARQTSGPPPIHSKPVLNPVTSFPLDTYRLAQEAALKVRSRLYPVNQVPQMNLTNFLNNSIVPVTGHNRKSIELQSTSLTNITHMDAGSSIESDCSSMYNSSPAPSLHSTQRAPREPSNLTRFLGAGNGPVQMHRSVEVLPNAIEMVGLSDAGKRTSYSKARTLEGGTGLRDRHFTPLHEAEESGVYSLPLEQVPTEESAPALPHRNTNPLHPISPAHRKQASQPTDQLMKQPQPQRPTSSTGWLNNLSTEPIPLPRVVFGSNYLTPDPNSSDERAGYPPKNMNQEVKRIQLNKPARQSYGFSISDDPVNLGVFVKNVDLGSVAERGDLKPLDKLLAINGVSLKDLNCEGTLALLQSSRDSLSLLVSRIPLSSTSHT